MLFYPQMKARDIALGLLILVLLIGSVLWIRKVRIERENNLKLEEVPTTEERISKTFNNFNIPNDVEKKELKDVSGGNNFGIATQDMVLVDLPEPEEGEFYQVWVERDGTLYSLGKMRMAKGGWIFEGRVPSGYQKVVVSKEKVFDSKLESRLLEGAL